MLALYKARPPDHQRCTAVSNFQHFGINLLCLRKTTSQGTGTLPCGNRLHRADRGSGSASVASSGSSRHVTARHRDTPERGLCIHHGLRFGDLWQGLRRLPAACGSVRGRSRTCSTRPLPGSSRRRGAGRQSSCRPLERRQPGPAEWQGENKARTRTSEAPPRPGPARPDSELQRVPTPRQAPHCPVCGRWCLDSQTPVAPFECRQESKMMMP